MKTAHKLKPQFVTNEEGEKTAVILSLEDYRSLLEDLEDLALIAERREESTIAHQQVIAELKKDGYL